MARGRRAAAAAAAAALGLALCVCVSAAPGVPGTSSITTQVMEDPDGVPTWARVWNHTHEWAFCADAVVLRERGVLDNLSAASLYWAERRWASVSGHPPDARRWSQKVLEQVKGAGLVEDAGETRGKFSLQWPRHLYHKHRMVFRCQDVCDSCALLDVPYDTLERHYEYGLARLRLPELDGQECPKCRTCPDLSKLTVKCGAATEFTLEPSAEADVQMNIPVRLLLASKKGDTHADGKTDVAKIFYSKKSSFHFYAWGLYLGWAAAIAQTIQGQPGGGRGLDIADLACGSGWMGILLGVAFPQSRVHFSDIDPSALNDVRTAVAANGMTGRTTVSLGDMWRAFDGLKGGDGERKRFHHVYFYPPQIVSDEEDRTTSSKEGSTMNVVSVVAPKRLFFFEECAKEWTQWLHTGGTLWLGTDHMNLAEVKIMFERYAGGRKIKWQRWFLAPSISPKKSQAVWWTAVDTMQKEPSHLLAVTLLD